MRNGSRRWPPKYETLNLAKTEKKINKKTGRLAQHYRCAACLEEFPQKDVQVDHKAPVVDPLVGFVNWDTFIERLFCDEENLQVLCKQDHLIKSQQEKLQSKSVQQLKQAKAPSNSKVNSRKKKPTT